MLAMFARAERTLRTSFIGVAPFKEIGAPPAADFADAGSSIAKTIIFCAAFLLLDMSKALQEICWEVVGAAPIPAVFM